MTCPGIVKVITVISRLTLWRLIKTFACGIVIYTPHNNSEKMFRVSFIMCYKFFKFKSSFIIRVGAYTRANNMNRKESFEKRSPDEKEGPENSFLCSKSKKIVRDWKEKIIFRLVSRKLRLNFSSRPFG